MTGGFQCLIHCIHVDSLPPTASQGSYGEKEAQLQYIPGWKELTFQDIPRAVYNNKCLLYSDHAWLGIYLNALHNKIYRYTIADST